MELWADTRIALLPYAVTIGGRASWGPDIDGIHGALLLSIAFKWFMGGEKESLGEQKPQQEKSVKQKYDLMGRKIDGYDVRKGLYIEMKGNDSAGKLKVVK